MRSFVSSLMNFGGRMYAVLLSLSRVVSYCRVFKMFVSENIYHQILACVPVYSVSLMNGVGYGWTAPTLLSLKDSDGDISLTSEQCSWIAAAHLIGRATGSIVIGPFGNTISRCAFIIIVFAINLITWPILLCFSHHINAFYVARFIFGLSCSIVDSILPVYTSETSDPKFRAIFNVFGTVLFFGGELLAFALPEFFSYYSILKLYTIFSLVVFASAFWLREPAQFLIQHGRREKAEKNFTHLRGATKSNSSEFEKIVENTLAEKEKTDFFQLIASPENYKSMRIVFVFNTAAVMTGFQAVNSFAPMLFTSSESDISAGQFLILLGVFLFLACCFSTFIVERFSRRSIALMSAATIALVQTSTAALFYVHVHVCAVPYFQWLIFATVTAYCSLFGMLMRPIMSLIRGELFPQSIQTYGSCIVSVTMSLVGALISKLFPDFPPEINFIFYAWMSLILFLYVYVELPETRNKSLTQIQDELKGKMITKF